MRDTASVNDTPLTDTDRLREEFRNAFVDYVVAGRQLHQLLVRIADGQRDRNPEEIANQQRVLNEMQSKYNRARSSYVEHILTGIGVE